MYTRESIYVHSIALLWSRIRLILSYKVLITVLAKKANLMKTFYNFLKLHFRDFLLRAAFFLVHLFPNSLYADMGIVDLIYAYVLLSKCPNSIYSTHAYIGPRE